MKGRKKHECDTNSKNKSFSRRLCINIIDKLHGKIPGMELVEDNLTLLSVGSDISERLKSYYVDKFLLMFKVFVCGLILAFLVLIKDYGSTVLTDGHFLVRKDETYTQELTLVSRNGTEDIVEIEVEPQALSDDECIELLEEAVSNMESYILGDNVSLDEVRSDLNLVEEIEDTPVDIIWDMDTYEVLNLDGSLRTKNLTESGTLVQLTATLTCGGQEMTYQATVNVLAPILSDSEEWLESVAGAVSETQESSRLQELMTLPTSIDGIDVSWEEIPDSDAFWVIVISLVSAAVLFMAKDNELKKEVKSRELQMKKDYARIVSKLVLLTGAGATIRTAWETIARDYTDKREAGLEDRRYAFEEMILACREMENGVAEAKAYENWGLRCRLPCYLKLAALLEQNIKKGGKGLSSILRSEIADAFEERKSSAVQQGEEAATKLLFPMVLLLVVVMILIIVPAAMSMQM